MHPPPSNKTLGLPSSGCHKRYKKSLCVNYVSLNKMTVSVIQPLPHADDMDDIAGSSYFAPQIGRAHV